MEELRNLRLRLRILKPGDDSRLIYLLMLLQLTVQDLCDAARETVSIPVLPDVRFDIAGNRWISCNVGQQQPSGHLETLVSDRSFAAAPRRRPRNLVIITCRQILIVVRDRPFLIGGPFVFYARRFPGDFSRPG